MDGWRLVGAALWALAAWMLWQGLHLGRKQARGEGAPVNFRTGPPAAGAGCLVGAIVLLFVGAIFLFH